MIVVLLKFVHSHQRLLAMVAVTLFAIGVRVWQIDLAPFDLDQTAILQTAADALDQHRLPLYTGAPLTIGARQPPLLALILAIPSGVSHNPALFAALQASLDAIGAGFIFLLALEFRGAMAAAASAGLLYATAPAAIVYSRKLWNPDFVPCLCAVGLWGTARFLRRGESRALAVAALAFAVAAELHPTSAVLLLTVVIAAVLRWRDVRWRPLASAAVIVGLTLAPYVYLQTQSGWSDVLAVLHTSGTPRQFNIEAVPTALLLIGGRFQDIVEAEFQLYNLQPLGSLIGQGSFGTSGAAINVAQEPLLWLVLALTLLGIGLAVMKVRSGWLLPLVLALPIAGVIASGQFVQPHYLLALLPPAMALAGIGLAAVRPRALGLSLLTIVIVWRLVDYAAFQANVAQVKVPGTYGIPMRYSIQAADLATHMEPTGPLLIARTEPNSAIFRYLSGGHIPVQAFNSQAALVIPPGGGVYVAQGSGRAQEALTSLYGPPTASVSDPSGAVVYAVYHLSSDDSLRLARSSALQPLHADVGNAVQFTGYRAEGFVAGRPSTAILAWRVLANPSPAQPGVRMFAHLLDRSGSVVSTDPDVEAFPRQSWQAGDTVLSWFDLNPPMQIPTGGYWLETGFYEASSGQRLTLRDGDREMGSALRMGPFRLTGGTTPPPLPTAIFGSDEIALAGIRTNGPQVILTWTALGNPRSGYTVFVHALDDHGQVVGQHDGPPVDGSFPTDLWQKGDVVEDTHILTGTISSATQLEIGLYTPGDLRRLPAKDTAGASMGDRWLVPLPLSH